MSSKIDRLANRINWSYLESSLGYLFKAGNSPSLRHVIGLLYLQSINNLSCQETIENYQSSSEWQGFCGCQGEGSKGVSAAALSIWSREIGAEGRKAMTSALGLPRRGPDETLH